MSDDSKALAGRLPGHDARWIIATVLVVAGLLWMKTDGLERRFDDLRADVVYQMTQLRTDLRRIDDRLRAVELALGNVETRLRFVENRLDAVENRLDAVEAGRRREQAGQAGRRREHAARARRQAASGRGGGPAGGSGARRVASPLSHPVPHTAYANRARMSPTVRHETASMVRVGCRVPTPGIDPQPARYPHAAYASRPRMSSTVRHAAYASRPRMSSTVRHETASMVRVGFWVPTLGIDPHPAR